jgi:hypothetical protein
MSKLYKLNKETHELVQQLAKQEGVECRIHSYFSITKEGYKYTVECGDPYVFTSQSSMQVKYVVKHDAHRNGDHAIFLLKPDQIHQILTAFEGVLGKRPPKTLSQALYQKWSDFKTGAFHRGDEGMIEVLSELNPILKSKIK